VKMGNREDAKAAKINAKKAEDKLNRQDAKM
jgi:hypothetical protein